MSRGDDLSRSCSGRSCHCSLMYSVTQARVVERVCRAEGSFLMQAAFYSRLPPHVIVNWMTQMRCNKRGAVAGDMILTRSLYKIIVALPFCRVHLSSRCPVSVLSCDRISMVGAGNFGYVAMVVLAKFHLCISIPPMQLR